MIEYEQFQWDSDSFFFATPFSWACVDMFSMKLKFGLTFQVKFPFLEESDN